LLNQSLSDELNFSMIKNSFFGGPYIVYIPRQKRLTYRVGVVSTIHLWCAVGGLGILLKCLGYDLTIKMQQVVLQRQN
jgi:hypothetical protein